MSASNEEGVSVLQWHHDRRSDIRLKSQQSFDTALRMGEFVELVSITVYRMAEIAFTCLHVLYVCDVLVQGLLQVTSHFSSVQADQKLTHERLIYLEKYFNLELSKFLGRSIDSESGLSGGKGRGSAQPTTGAASVHSIFSQVVSRIKACRESHNSMPLFSRK